MPTATPDLFNTVLAQTIPRAAEMGIEVELQPGYVKSKTPFDGNGNHIGTMYAGVLFTAAELLGGAIALSTFDMTKFYPVVKGLSINFRRPATGAVFAEASINPELAAQLAETATANGKAEFVFETTLTDEAGEVVATTEGTYQLRSHGG
jgi:acyl-coenzyme A thioesterase PaaI-like protein